MAGASITQGGHTIHWGEVWYYAGIVYILYRVLLTATVSREFPYIGTGHVTSRSSGGNGGRGGGGGSGRFRGAPAILGV